MVQRLPILFAVCLGLVLPAAPSPVRAHRGRVALAFPLEQITADGELSDWPADLPRYPILLPEYGDYPHGPADYEGYFRVGYNLSEQVLYLAVEVRDESAVIGPADLVDWTAEDGSDLYVHREHSDMKAPVVQYALLGEVVRYGNLTAAQRGIG